MMRVSLLTKLLAMAFGWNPVSSTARKTFSRNSGRTGLELFKTRETVAIDTLARCAMSLIVTDMVVHSLSLD